MLFSKIFEQEIRSLHPECKEFHITDECDGFDRHGPKAIYYYIFVTDYDALLNITTCNVYTAYQDYTASDNPKQYTRDCYKFEGHVQEITSFECLKQFQQI